MDAQTIEKRIYAGRGKAAQRIGRSCTVYRPIDALAPLGNSVRRTFAAFNAADPTYSKPNPYGKPVWFADLDGRYTQAGDYLVRNDGATWFIAAQQSMLPIIAVECDRQVKVSRQAALTAVGAIGYGGIIAPSDILGTTGALWPASILVANRPLPMTDLPADVKQGGSTILLPPSVPVTLLAADLITDDLGRRYAIESAEVTDLGYRITAHEVHT